MYNTRVAYSSVRVLFGGGMGG